MIELQTVRRRISPRWVSVIWSAPTQNPKILADEWLTFQQDIEYVIGIPARIVRTEGVAARVRQAVLYHTGVATDA